MLIAFASVCCVVAGLLTLLLFGTSESPWVVWIAVAMGYLAVVVPAMANAFSADGDARCSALIGRASRRAVFLVWVLAICPALGWLASIWIIDEQEALYGWTLFGLPIILAIAGGVALRESAGWVAGGALLTVPGSAIALWASLIAVFY